MPSGNYYLSDLLDSHFTLSNNVYGYDLPDFNSQKVTVLHTGDSILIHSFQNVNGRTWLGFYLNADDYNNFQKTYIALNGAPASDYTIPAATIGSAGIAPTITTVEQQAAAAAETNIFDQLGSLVTKIGLGIAGIVAVSKFAGRNKKQ